MKWMNEIKWSQCFILKSKLLQQQVLCKRSGHSKNTVTAMALGAVSASYTFIYTGRGRPTCVRYIACLIEVQKPTTTCIFCSWKFQENFSHFCETPQNGTFVGVGVGFGKFSYVKVGSAIPHSKGLHIHTILL